MKRFCPWLAALLWLLWAAPGLAAPSPHDVLRQVYDRYAKLEAYTERAEVSIDVMGRQSKAEISYARRRPLSVYASSTAGFGITIVCDGTQRWEHSTRLREYVEDRAADFWPQEATDIENVTAGFALPVKAPIAHWLIGGQPFIEEFDPPAPLAEQTLDGRQVWVVELPLRAIYGIAASHRLYIGREDVLVYRDEAEYRVAGVEGDAGRIGLVRVEHREIALNAEIAADRFQFAPPVGAKRVVRLNLAGQEWNPPPLIGKPAPDFEARDIAGNQSSLADLRGRPVVLYWWATWCPACVMEIAHIEQIYRLAHDQGLQVVGIDVGEKEETVLGFMREHDITFPMIIAKGRELDQKYPRAGITPFLVFIDAEGIVREIGTVYHPAARLAAALDKIGVKLPQPKPRLPAETAAAHREEAIKAYLAGDEEGAAAALRAAAEADPKSADAWVWTGAYHLARGDLDQAEAAFARAEKDAPKDADARAAMAGDYLAAKARPKEAVRLAKEAVGLGGQRINSHLLLAEAYIADQQLDEAIGMLTTLGKQTRGRGDISFLLGVAHERKGDKEAALTAYRGAEAFGHPCAAAAIARVKG